MTEKMMKFLEVAEKDAQLAEKINSAASLEAVIALAKEKGFALTGEDLRIDLPTGEVDDDALDEVAGGAASGAVSNAVSYAVSSAVSTAVSSAVSSAASGAVSSVVYSAASSAASGAVSNAVSESMTGALNGTVKDFISKWGGLKTLITNYQFKSV